MAAVLWRVERHHDLVTFALADLVIATGAPVHLVGLVRLDVPYLDLVGRFRPVVRGHAQITLTRVRPRAGQPTTRAAARRSCSLISAAFTGWL